MPSLIAWLITNERDIPKPPRQPPEVFPHALTASWIDDGVAQSQSHRLNLGVALKAAIKDGVSSLSYWPPVTLQAMSNPWLKEQGLLSIKDLWCKVQDYSA